MRAIVVLGFGMMLLSGWACSGGASERSPVAPSPVTAATAPTPAAGGVGGGAYELMDVTFPPRNEALQFRNALETKYRDGLRRSAVQTFVDQEGTVVWAQEYLRYRVNLCSHPDAVSRVMQQIDGRGIAATCGVTSTATFPPRNEPLDFMVQLEAKYRDGLRRSSGPSFVDVEGNIVWTQEYLRYRVSNCAHAEAQQKVFDQIDGRGVQGDCVPVNFTGRWSGTVRSTGCAGEGALAQVCRTVPSITDTITLQLTQRTATFVVGTMNLGGYTTGVSGSASGNGLALFGQFVAEGITTTLAGWQTSVSGSNMIGRFNLVLSAPPNSGFANYFMTMDSVSRTGFVTDPPATGAADVSDALRRASRVHTP